MSPEYTPFKPNRTFATTQAHIHTTHTLTANHSQAGPHQTDDNTTTTTTTPPPTRSSARTRARQQHHGDTDAAACRRRRRSAWSLLHNQFRVAHDYIVINIMLCCRERAALSLALSHTPSWPPQALRQPASRPSTPAVVSECIHAHPWGRMRLVYITLIACDMRYFRKRKWDYVGNIY